ncbi:MAG TPA: vitamin K epoxide reductase family protein [Gemmatimonadaceae bacterium]
MLTLIGLLIAGYLTLLHYDSAVPLVCSAGSIIDCETVLGSASSVVLGVPVAAWGVLWFVVALALAVASARTHERGEPATLRAVGLAWVLAGTAGVLWLVYQEIGVIGKICAWCTTVHVVILALLVIQVTSDPRHAPRP